MSTSALEARNFSKGFGGVRALDNATLIVAPGEVHGLLGANGSGKSTLIKILAGYHAPDAGTLTVGGQPVPLPVTLRQRRSVGMEFVHQDLALVSSLTVAENLCVADIASPQNRFFLSGARQRRKTRRILDKYNLDIDPAAQILDLRPLERAMVAIVRAIEELDSVTADLGHNGVLILDEPTVFLPKDGAELLFRLVRGIANSGSSVIFVSHKLEEVAQVTDRITILRDGSVVLTAPTAETDEATIVQMIVGHELKRATTGGRGIIDKSKRHVIIDNAEGGRLQSTSFEIAEGEIVGLTGLVGSGFEELPYTLIGTSPGGAQGELQIAGERYPLPQQTPWRAAQAGIALVPADRAREGGVPSLSVEDNLMLPVLSRYQRGPFQRRRQMKEDARHNLTEFQVKPNDPNLEYSSLSGGNQQKALLAKWLQTKPRLLILHEPSQGVDIGAREQIHDLIRQAAKDGMAVICAGSDYEEIALLCDRVLIFADGQLRTELSGVNVTKQQIIEQAYTASRLMSSFLAEGQVAP
jgi:ribose transport system ATP-binding protein